MGRPRLAPILLALALACDGEGAPTVECGELRPGPESARQNVVLVVVDTLRRDAAGAYGGEAATPTFDRIADRGLLFEEVWSQAPWTKPAMATLFTSLHPSQHQVLTHPQEGADGRGSGTHDGGHAIRSSERLAPGFATLAERYAAAGFQTAAFVSNPWLASELGFDQGFEHYDDSMARWSASDAEVSDAARLWIRRRSEERPYFLYVHYLAPHQPYGRLERDELLDRADAIRRAGGAPNRRAAREIARLARYRDGSYPTRRDELPPNRRLVELAYHEGVETFDAAFEDLLRGVERHGEPQRTALLVTSDHGESLYEHGFGNHGSSLYEPEVAIPFVARLPGAEPQPARVRCRMGLIDVMPLLCRYSGLDCPAEAKGRDHLLASGTDAPPDFLVLEGVGGAPQARALLAGRWKLVREPRHPRRATWQLYDLEADPRERRNRASPRPPTDGPAGETFRRLSRALPDAVAPFDAPERERLDLPESLSEELRALGYAAPEGTAPAGRGEDS